MMNRNDMYEPILTVMATAEEEGLHRKAIARQIEDWFTLTEDEWAELRKTHKVDKYSTRFQKEVDYALNRLRNAGLSSGSSSRGRGYHQITEQGRKILETVAARDIPSKVQGLISKNEGKNEKQKPQKASEKVGERVPKKTEKPSTPDEQMETLYQQLNDRACPRVVGESERDAAL